MVESGQFFEQNGHWSKRTVIWMKMDGSGGQFESDKVDSPKYQSDRPESIQLDGSKLSTLGRQ